MAALNALVSDAVDVVVHSRRTGDRVWVDEIVAVEDHQGGLDATSFTVTDVFRRSTPDEPLLWSGHVPVRCARALEAAGHDPLEVVGGPAGDRSAVGPGARR